MFSLELIEKTKLLLDDLRIKNMRLVTAESCTGGLISALITEIPGSSAVFERGFITYSNDAKIDLLTVPTFYIEEHGAVSMHTATAMAEGALLVSRADISIAVTGCAGPDGGTKETPVGRVYIASSTKNTETIYKEYDFKGSRQDVRLSATQQALAMIQSQLENYSD